MTTANPPGSVTDDDTGQRYYPVDGENFWSVSTATGVIDKDGLPRWAASVAAKLAFEELPTVLTASRTKPCGRTYYKCKHDWRDGHDDDCACRVCQTCVTKWLTERHITEKNRRADEGKRTHNVINWWALHGEWIGFGDDIAPYVAAFRALTDEYGLAPDSFRLTECVVISRAHKYAGATDGIIRFHARRTRAAAELVARVLASLLPEGADPITAEMAIEQDLYVDLVIDFKTQDKPVEKEKFYSDHALQLAGYRHAPVMRIKNTEQEADMPDTHGAALIHLRPDGCTVRLAVADESTFEAFLLALNLFRWLVESGTKSVSVRSFPLPKPAKKAAPRKAAAAKKTNGKQPGTGPNGCAAYAGERGYCLGPGGPHPGGKHWFLGEPEPPADPARTAPAKATAAPAARRTVAERIGATSYPGRAGATLTDSDIPF